MKALSVWKVTLFISLFITLFGNFSFWKSMLDNVSVKQDALLIISFFIIIVGVINFLLTLASFKPFFKAIAILILLVSAAAAYFMDNYGVMIDKGMIRNVLLTDFHEANELFSFRLVVTIFLLGILPTVFIYNVKINYQPFLKGLLHKTVVAVLSLGVVIGTLYSNYQELTFFGRSHRELRHLINPTNYIFSLKSIISKQLSSGVVVVKPIENDAKKTPRKSINKKPSLVILVLGETARAMNFSINGYQRETNPLLGQHDIINFSNVSACGTATAVSVPCLFSKFSRTEFSYSKGKEYQNLLDVVSHANYGVLWRDNNSGCQGTCKRVTQESLTRSKDADFCKNGNCVDEILLSNLQTIIDKNTIKTPSGDQFIVLHQKGNHGPTYHLRYPERFEKFKPACKTNQLRMCSQEEVVNAYDNAILYTDYFLSKTIEFLKNNSKIYNTAMVYISDHGESLGENNIYLHGLPYVIAPEHQIKVPFLMWLSEAYQQNFDINKSCVSRKSDNELSHDNLFSTMLGLLGIQTSVYNSGLDLFESCKQTSLVGNMKSGDK